MSAASHILPPGLHCVHLGGEFYLQSGPAIRRAVDHLPDVFQGVMDHVPMGLPMETTQSQGVPVGAAIAGICADSRVRHLWHSLPG